MSLVLGKHTGVFSCPRSQAAGRLCHLVNHGRMARDAGGTSKNSSGVNALGFPHSLSLFIVQLGTLRKVQVLQGYILSVRKDLKDRRSITELVAIPSCPHSLDPDLVYLRAIHCMSTLLSLSPSLHILTNPPSICVCCSGTNESRVLCSLVEQQSKEVTSKGKEDVETWYLLGCHAD